eukprot:5393609-Pleurochrysis_carterae.AAC.1
MTTVGTGGTAVSLPSARSRSAATAASAAANQVLDGDVRLGHPTAGGFARLPAASAARAAGRCSVAAR